MCICVTFVSGLISILLSLATGQTHRMAQDKLQICILIMIICCPLRSRHTAPKCTRDGYTNNDRVAMCQGKIRKTEIFSRSGNCQGILKSVREIWNKGKCQGILEKNEIQGLIFLMNSVSSNWLKAACRCGPHFYRVNVVHPILAYVIVWL